MIVIVGALGHEVGGATRVIESWARVLGTAGHSVVVLTRASADAIPLPSLPGVTSEQFAVDDTTNRLWKFRKAVASCTRALAHIDRRERIDLVLSHDAHYSGRIRRVLPHTPQILTIHSPFVEENRLNNWKYTRDPRRRWTYPATWLMARRAERQGLEAASWVHTLSEYTWSLLSARHPELCRSVPWQLIPGTFDQRRFVPAQDRRAARGLLGLRPDDRVLLTVRRLIPRNGVDRILDAAARFRERPEIQFVIGGGGELLEPLRRRVAAESLAGTVAMPGLIPEDRLPLYYQAADAFLLPTRDLECFGLPVVEAMAAGCTPLVMPDGGPAEVCRPFPRCVAAANTTAAFTDLVARYVAGTIPAHLDGVAAHARRNYSEEAVRPAILGLVERALREGPRRR